MRRRTAVAAAALLTWTTLLVGPAVATDTPVQDDTPTTDADEQVDELPDGARTIIGSPDPGPKPERPGDRGGWAQLLTLGVLVAAIGFIMWRVFRAARAATPEVSSPDPRRSP